MSSEKISVRQAKLKDAHEISLCLQAAFEAFRSAYTPGAFEDTVPGPVAVAARFDTMELLVASAGSDRVEGTIACLVDGEEGHLRGMAVRPEWQGRAVASQLLAAAEEALRSRGCTHVTLDTTAALPRAIRFYEKHGYARSGKVADYHGKPLYELVKSLRLPE